MNFQDDQGGEGWTRMERKQQRVETTVVRCPSRDSEASRDSRRACNQVRNTLGSLRSAFACVFLFQRCGWVAGSPVCWRLAEPTHREVCGVSLQHLALALVLLHTLMTRRARGTHAHHICRRRTATTVLNMLGGSLTYFLKGISTNWTGPTAMRLN